MTAIAVILILSLSAEGDEPHERLKRAAAAYRAADFPACAASAAGLENTELLSRDTALFLYGQCCFYAHEPKAARAAFARLLDLFPQSSHATLAAHRIADCSWELGDEQRAWTEHRKAAKLPPDPRADAAAGLFRRAIHLLRSGRTAQGESLWRLLRVRSPDHPLLQAFPADRPPPALSPQEAVSVAERLHDLRRWEEALQILDQAPDPRNVRERYRLAYRTGRILFDMRDRYPQAADILHAARDHAPSPAEAETAWFFASRSLGRMDRDAEAIKSHLEMVRRHPAGDHAAQALFYAGWLEQNQGHCDRALPILQRAWTEYPKDRWAREARWTAAWCLIRGKEWTQAIDTLAPHLASPSPDFAAQALYWSAVARESLGEPQEAHKLWRQTIRRFPLTWYALLAGIRLGSGTAAQPPPPPVARNVAPVADTLLDQARELTDCGLGSLAALKLRAGEKEYFQRLSGQDQRSTLLALLDAYRSAGEYQRPWELTVVRRAGDLQRLPVEASRPIWDHSYPRCERERLVHYAGKDPSLVLFLQAIMRTESGFDPSALSTANARGLLQLYPPTASRVLKLMGIEYDLDRLFDPDYNIRGASWFIGRLVAKFRRQWPLAAAAYNAGAPAMMKWCREFGSLPLDAFVESIPWGESRNYAKKVTEAFARYAYLEGETPPSLLLAVDDNWFEDDLDF